MARKKSDPATPDYNALSDRQRRILRRCRSDSAL